MSNFFKKNNSRETLLYNKILSLSRNKYLYTEMNIGDTFQNRINLIFIHISFLFIKIKDNKTQLLYNEFYQKMFDLIFENIELNMREMAYSDTAVNKSMKKLVKSFYNILLNCENYSVKSSSAKITFLNKYVDHNKSIKNSNNTRLVDYFDKYQAFCLDLSSDSVLRGDLNFNYK